MPSYVVLDFCFVSAIQPGNEQKTVAQRLQELSLAGSKNR